MKRSTALVALIPWAAFSLAAVALPSALPLAAARHRWVKLLVLVVMAATAALAGVLVVTTDDAQAGLAVLFVPYGAVPLALGAVPSASRSSVCRSSRPIRTSGSHPFGHSPVASSSCSSCSGR